MLLSIGCSKNTAGNATQPLTTEESMKKDLNYLQDAQQMMEQEKVEEALEVCRQIELSNAACYLSYIRAKQQKGEVVYLTLCDEIHVGLTGKNDVTTEEMKAVEVCYGLK